MRRALRIAPAVAFALGATLSARASSAADPRGQACFDAAEKGQEQRDEGKLLAARESFLACSREPCHGVVKTDCITWLADVEARLPSVVVSARDPEGRDLADLTVTLDGRPFLTHLDGKAVSVDPGAHLFRFAHAPSPALSETVILYEGGKNRLLTARFQAPALAVGSPRPRIPVLSFVLGGVGVASLGAFAALGVHAKSERDDLRATCAPHCTEAQVDSVRTQEIAANVFLGAGAIALTSATLIALLRPGAPPPSPPPPPASFALHPLVGGAMGILDAHF
jgi:hypothetical protein